MKNIQFIHEKVFTFLDDWSKKSRHSNDIGNTFFYMRSVRDERFRKGYWFPGNDSYLCISFWAGGDSHNKTPNIYFEISEKNGCRAIIIAKDSPAKHEYFDKMLNYIKKYNLRYNDTNTNGKLWYRKLSNDYQNWEIALNEYIEWDKRQIDEYLYRNELVEFEEYISKFGFINPSDFDTMYSKVLKERDNLAEAEYRIQREFLNKPKLPFSLLGINIENYQGVKNTNLDELPPDARWIYITGENGYGKTTILQSIALGLSNNTDLEKFLDSQTRITTELVYKNEKNFITRSKGNLSKLSNHDFGRLVLGYGPARLNVQSESSENVDKVGNSNVISLFDNTTLLKNINYELFASNYSDNRIFVDLQDLIRIVTKGRISEITFVKREAYFIETLDNNERLEALPLSKLAAGFRSIINMVFDIYIKFRNIHVNMPYSEFFGIVLIDEIENHLHPILQRELPKALSEVFPKIQFIISTHSPIPLLAAEKNSVILKVSRDKVTGVNIIRLDQQIDFPNLLPNTILTSPIFGFQDIFSESKDENSFARVETTYNELVSNNKQKEKIDNFLDEKTTNELLKLLIK